MVDVAAIRGMLFVQEAPNVLADVSRPGIEQRGCLTEICARTQRPMAEWAGQAVPSSRLAVYDDSVTIEIRR